MKKYVLAILVLAVGIGFSAFTILDKKTEKKQDTYYWFQADPGAGDQSDFIDDEVAYSSGPSTNPPSVCEVSNTYKCIVGFSSSQVTFSGGTYHINTSVRQAPATSDGRFRATE